MRILLVGGGSVGHTAPAVAVARAVMRQKPGTVVHIACGPRTDETAFLTAENLPHSTLPLPHRSVLLPMELIRSYRAAKGLIERFQPDCVFSKGGALSVPVCLAASRKKIPIVLHESDARPGRASRLIARRAQKVCTGFPSTHLSKKEIWTGNPVRPGIAHGKREEGLRRTGLSGTKPILLITGGSQGAASLNDAVHDHLDALLSLCDIIHLTGRGKKTVAQERPGYFAEEFALSDLPDLYAAATLALSRAGAGSLSELAANGIPTIVVPLEGVAQDHQMENARQAAASGGALLLEQAELRSNLLPTIRSLLAHEEKLREMADAMRTLSKPDAAEKIAAAVIEAATM